MGGATSLFGGAATMAPAAGGMFGAKPAAAVGGVGGLFANASLPKPQSAGNLGGAGLFGGLGI